MTLRVSILKVTISSYQVQIFTHSKNSLRFTFYLAEGSTRSLLTTLIQRPEKFRYKLPVFHHRLHSDHSGGLCKENMKADRRTDRHGFPRTDHSKQKRADHHQICLKSLARIVRRPSLSQEPETREQRVSVHDSKNIIVSYTKRFII